MYLHLYIVVIRDEREYLERVLHIRNKRGLCEACGESGKPQ
jgi:acetolactate synthase regulatory subunit